ncbi:hexosyltransferase [Plakobranchus ocellatus]|uniref:Hexosyltransferase n=1 Tax=Plakobranchus ocellatus TaxID=259542 RepID=A0AAV3XZH4_9GAST|nr:hexosyltransferase [Plakobranchus ocellatus]
MSELNAVNRRVCHTNVLTQALAISTVVLCVGFIVRLSCQRKVSLLLVRVQDQANTDRLMRVIIEQREQIKDLSQSLKVLQQRADDTPTIKYPKRASDDLTGVLIGTDDECGNASSLDAVMLVHSAAGHFSRRERYRKAYTNGTLVNGQHKLKVVFLIGHVLDAQIQIDLEIENRKYGDTLIGVFLDTYQNLTLKAVMGYRWAAEYCGNTKLIIKMDDDVFFNVGKFFDTFWSEKTHSKRSIFCNVWEQAPVGRSGKWKVEKDIFANDTYHFPYCAGFFIVITTDLLVPMYNAAKSIDFFWIDDVFMYGMVPDVLGGVTYWQIGQKSRKITEKYKDYKQCRVKKGISGCSYWAVLTDGASQFDVEHEELIKHEKTILKTSSAL